MVQQLRVNHNPRRLSRIPAASDPRPRIAKGDRHPFLQAIEGSLQVFTSVHRSFFTNVMVQALRSADQGMSVLVAQFLKGGIDQGPEHMTQMGQNLDWVRCGYSGCIFENTDDAQAAVNELWDYVKSVVQDDKYSLVMLDELSLAIDYGLIPETEVLELLEQRPSQMDIILTGPKMPYSILSMADQVTEFRREFLP
ncbi:cob(I)yrinic acid a,c-diamide adenosyltransferase [Leptothoe spongobia]|uniref:Cob(I)yrinic acid a,c-diamide adenosyltransferase n=1 Tax=Leptothoe spongobia TAU-MAC 1115 TaxID=1967444 RepID=A0A947DBF1_9CYAN|nr:cob(I)yrinic acid a,c-diamide adenosyltransferase [Leptothoe spongobia]MBT9313938.1 cob(I)yrinic acid a,c-diamide adenosyltransferase [Leptothoe spongobia TAU-MAC 1115]